MRNILIATHSTFATGIKGSLDLLIGEQPGIFIIDAYADDSDFTIEVDKFFDNSVLSDEYVVFTDLFGGSVNQKIFAYKNTYDFYLITGFNLPVLLEIILYRNKLSVSIVEEIIEKSRQELLLVKISEEEQKEEEDFI